MNRVKTVLYAISPICREKYSKETERAFRKDYDEKSLPAVRVAYITGLILYALFAILDYNSSTTSLNKVLFIRLGIICPLIIITYILTYTEFVQKHLQQFLFICSLMSAGGTLAMIFTFEPYEPAYYFYYSGVLLIIMWSYTLTRLRVAYAVVSTWLMILTYNVIAVVFKGLLSHGADSVSFKLFLSANFFLISSNVIGMMVGMTVEYYHKKEFVLRYKLKQAHEKIEKEILERIKNEETVKSLLVEKEFILKEVHHRIKNNMTTIIALLNLQTGTVKDISAVTAIKEAESRVRSMMVLYDKLYLSENFNHLSVKDYLSSLIDEIIMNFPNRGSVAVIKNIDDFILDSKSLFSVGIIINELLTNIMKYAFQGKEGGVITASASLMDKNVQLVIQDDGIGIPEWVDFENSNGFGLMLIKMLTHQLSGNIRIERNNGTGFILEFRANPGAGYILKAAV